MDDLIWVGNVLYPRWFVLSVMGMAGIVVLWFSYALVRWKK
jgi:hypothetical protein